MTIDDSKWIRIFDKFDSYEIIRKYIMIQPVFRIFYIDRAFKPIDTESITSELKTITVCIENVFEVYQNVINRDIVYINYIPPKEIDLSFNKFLPFEIIKEDFIFAVNGEFNY